MNKAKLVLASAIMVAITTAQAYTLKTDAEKIGYTIGADMGSTLSEFAGEDNSVDFDALIVGLRDAYNGNDLSMDSEEMDATMQTFAQKRMEQMQKEQAKLQKENLKAGREFLKSNAKKDGVKTTDSGLQYKVLEEGDGEKPSEDSNVTVNYEGRLIDGTVFDSSEKAGKPVTFNVNEVIDGWVEGLQLMKEGSKYRFFIPAELAYGEKGAGKVVPPNSTLIFDVELLKINADETAQSTDAEVDAAIDEAKENANEAEQDAKQIAEEVQQEAKEADKQMAVEVEQAKDEAQEGVEKVERENNANTKRAEVKSPKPEVKEEKDSKDVSANAKKIDLESQETEANADNNIQKMGKDAAEKGEKNAVENAIEATGKGIENATQAIEDTVSGAADSVMGKDE